MKKFIILFTLLFFTTINSQTTISQNSFRSTLGDSSDLPTGIWNAGFSGGPVSFGIYSDNYIYFTQGTYLFKAEEGTDKIETLEKNQIPGIAKSFKIDGDNLYIIFNSESDNKNKVAKMKMSDLSKSSATQYGGITNGINKFEEIDGYVFLAHNKNGTINDKIVGNDLLNNTQAGFTYTQDFRDFTVNGNYLYLIADNGTTTRTIEVVDFSNKSNVQKVGEIVVTSAVSLAYDNGYLFVACTDNQGIQVIDVSTSTAPIKVGNYRAGEQFASYEQVFIEGTTAYIRRNNEITLLNISAPSAPTKLRSNFLQDLPGMFTITNVTNGKIYYEHSGHLGIIETANWVHLGKEYLSPAEVQRVKTDGTNIVIYDYAKFYFGSLTDNKFSPNIFDALSASVSPEDFEIDGDYFYISDYNKLYIHQISNLSSTPQAVQSYVGQYSAFKVGGNLAVVGGFVTPSFDNYFEIIDLTDKQNPTKLYSGTNLTNGTVTSIEFSSSKNTLYLTSELSGKVWFTIYNITDKTAPVKISETEICIGKNAKMEITESTAAIIVNKSELSGYKPNLFAYNISDPANIVLTSNLQISNNKYNDALFIEGLLLINIPQDNKLYTYTLIESSGNFAAGATVNLDAQLDNISGFVDHSGSTSTVNKFANSIMGGEDNDHGYIYGSAQSNGYEVIEFKKKKKATTKVTLTTTVKPAEAASAGCKVTPSGGQYKKGTAVSMKGTAVDGWVWSHWSGDLSGSINPAELIMDGNKSVTGNFLPILILGFAATSPNNFYPPKPNDKIYLGTTNLTAEGVDWQLLGLTYTATASANSEYTTAYLEYNGTKLKGSFTTDGDGKILSISFPLAIEIAEGETFSCKFYYQFDFPSTFKSINIPAPIGEVKNLKISISRTQVNAIPVPESARPGVKLPPTVFQSNKQVIASIWNISNTPNLGYNTIQEAIDAPQTSDGDIIKVEAGNYKMNTKVDKSVTIFASDGSDSTIVRGIEKDKDVFKIVKNNVKISGFKIKQPKHYSYFPKLIHIIGEGKKITNCEISNNLILDGYEENIAIVNADNCKIINNAIYDYKVGINLSNADYNLIKGNQIGIYNDETFYALVNGINFGDNCVGNRIEENQISGNDESGISLDGTNIINNKIINNKIGTNRLGGDAISNKTGIMCGNYGNNIIQYNIIENNLISGNTDGMKLGDKGKAIIIFGTNTKYNQIKSNKIGLTSNGYATLLNKFGIDIDFGASENIIEDNTIVADGILAYAIRIGYSNVANSGNIIKNNKIGTNIIGDERLTKANGIMIFNNSSNIEITGNLISGNLFALSIEGKLSKNLLISNNKIGTNLAGTSVIANVSGIFLSEVQNARIENNLISGNLIGIEITSLGANNNMVIDNKIGTDINGVTTLGNRNGIFIQDGAKRNIVERNLISGNTYPIVISDMGTNKNVIKQNIIGLDINEKKILLFSELGIIIQKSASHNIVYNNVVGGFTKIGIAVLEDANHNKVIKNYVGTNSTFTGAFSNNWGIDIGNADYNQLAGNWVWNNIHGIGNLGKYNIIANNNLKNNSGNTGVHLNGASNTKIIGNVITEDGSNAIVTENGSNPIITNNNIYNNSGFGLENKDKSVTIVANGNWWGDESGPSSLISGKVQVDTWLSKQKGLSVVPGLDTLFIPVGGKDSLSLYVANWNNNNDLINITLNPEKNNWLSSANNFSYQLSDSTLGTNEVKFKIPTTAIVNDYSKVNIYSSSTTTSEIDTSLFYVVAYEQNLKSIAVSPDSTILAIGDSIQFSAVGYDNKSNEVNIDVEWTSTKGKTDTAGYFFTEGIDSSTVVEIFAKNIRTGIIGKATVFIGTPTSVEKERIIPKQYSLNQNYPNPFNPSTTISYGLPFESKVRVEIFNILGQRVDIIANGVESAGLHSTLWDAGHLASGIYIIRINATSVNGSANFTKSIKMLLIK